MNTIVQTFFHSVVSIIILFIFARLMGKKQISQLTFFDYVVGISIGAIAGVFAMDETNNYTKGLTALIVVAAFPLLLSISLKSYRARKILEGALPF